MDELKDLLKALRSSDQSLKKLRKGIDRVLPSRRTEGLAADSTESGTSQEYDHEVENDDRDAAIDSIPSQSPDTPVLYEINKSNDDTVEEEESSDTAVRDDPAISALVDSTRVEGEVLNGRYKLIQYLGLGRTSTMYKALDDRKSNTGTLDPYVAVKIVKEQLCSDREWYTAFQKAATESQSLIHENIARVYSLEQDHDTVYLVTEYICGETLSAKIFRASFNGMPLKDTLHIVRTIGQALAFAHEQGIVHYDLYPGNVYVTDQSTVKVANFAVAQAFRSTAVGVRHPQMLDAISLSYKSPEALEHRSPDPRDDVYSLACITYELLTGRHPFDRKLANEAQIAQINPQKPEALSYGQWKALKSALFLDRAERTPSTTIFLQQFNQPSLNIPDWFLLAVAGISGVCVAGSVVFLLVKYNLIPMMPPEQQGALIENRSSYSEAVSKSPEAQALSRSDDEQRSQASTATVSELEPSDITADRVKTLDSQPELPTLPSSALITEQTPDANSTTDSAAAPAERVQAASPADAGWGDMAQQSQRINYLMAAAYMQITMKKLTLPEGDNALESYKKVLDLKPQHEEALDGIAKIRSTYISWAETAEQRGEWGNAELFLNRALRITPSDAELKEELRRVREKKTAFLSREAESAELAGPIAAGSALIASQASPAAIIPERISIGNVKHEILATGNRARALLQATVSGKASRVKVLIEIREQVASYEMNASGSSAEEQHSNNLLYTREIPLPYPAEKTTYVLAAYKPDGTVIYSPKEGTQPHLIEPLLQGPAVVINEFMVSNDMTIADPQGDYDDWIELYNKTPKTLDMSGYYLSDDKGDPKKWQFPRGTAIAGYGYLLVWADGEPQYTEVGRTGSELHTNFKLSRGGEYVLLVDTDAKNNKVLDIALYERQPSDLSISRNPDGLGDFSVTSVPTPGRKN